jgi:GDP-L-fucose synthase
MNLTSKIYVAGHRGLVGSAILRALQKRGYKNVCFKMSKELDLRRQEDTEVFFKKEKPEYVFLAAAKVGGILANATYPAEFIYDNMAIAANVVNAAHKGGVKKLLNFGSSCIYPKLSPQPIKEESLLTGALESTSEPYAIAKIAAIKLCKYYNEQYGTNFMSVMPATLYGANDNFNLEMAHVLPALIRKFHLARLLREKRYESIKTDIARFSLGFNSDLNLNLNLILERLGITGKTVTLWGTGEPYREFLYVDDLADACVFVMENCNAKELGEFVNIGKGEDIKIKELAPLIKQIVGFEGEIRYDPSKPDGTPRKLLDSSRIRSLVWEPKTPLEEGIRKTYAWYLQSSSGLNA